MSVGSKCGFVGWRMNCLSVVFQSFLYGMVSGGLGGSTETYSAGSSERSAGVGGNPRPYLAPPAGLNDYPKQVRPKRAPSDRAAPPSSSDSDSGRRAAGPAAENAGGATAPKRNTPKEKKDKPVPAVFVWVSVRSKVDVSGAVMMVVVVVSISLRWLVFSLLVHFYSVLWFQAIWSLFPSRQIFNYFRLSLHVIVIMILQFVYTLSLSSFGLLRPILSCSALVAQTILPVGWSWGMRRIQYLVLLFHGSFHDSIVWRTYPIFDGSFVAHHLVSCARLSWLHVLIKWRSELCPTVLTKPPSLSLQICGMRNFGRPRPDHSF